MGLRMSIYPVNDPDDWYGDDHKMYGYWAYDDVKDSFDYLVSTLEPFDYGAENFDDIREFYDDSFLVGGFEVTLTNDEFKKFSKLYLKDLISTGHTEHCVEAARKYFDILGAMDEDKCLEWY